MCGRHRRYMSFEVPPVGGTGSRELRNRNSCEQTDAITRGYEKNILIKRYLVVKLCAHVLSRHWNLLALPLSELALDESFWHSFSCSCRDRIQSLLLSDAITGGSNSSWAACKFYFLTVSENDWHWKMATYNLIRIGERILVKKGTKSTVVISIAIDL